MKTSSQPWHDLPPEISEVLRPVLPDIGDEVIAAIRELPAYARPLEGAFGAGLRAGVEEGLSHLLAEIEAGGPVPRPDVYRALGRGEMRAGRSLDSLLSAYRIGARVAWRRFVAAGRGAGLAPEVLYRLAEAIFAYIDVLSAESAEGHAHEQSAAAGEAQLRRQRLVRLLVHDVPTDPAIAAAAAAEAGWRLPHTLAAIAVAADETDGSSLRLPLDAIAETLDGILCLLIADPDGPARRRTVEQAVLAAGVTAGLGPTVLWTEAASSFALARGALALGGAPGTVIAARDHAGQLLLRSEPRLARELADACLAPLHDLPPGSRQRLTDTLAAWLDEQGRLGLVARRLGVHPQTARYRLTRLRELFGDVLDDPDERFWLQVALRSDAAGAPARSAA